MVRSNTYGMSLKEYIVSKPGFKKFMLRVVMPANDPRPRWFVRGFINPFFHKRGKNVIIRRHCRLDTFPFNKFKIGHNTILEDFAVVNNGVGNVLIGSETIIGIGCVLIGPVIIGNNVMLAQHITISGLNHSFKDVNLPPSKQKVDCKDITIEDNVWIGANAVITAGVTIGKHAIIGAGSIVTKSVPEYSVVVGNPAKIVKQYNRNTGNWDKY